MSRFEAVDDVKCFFLLIDEKFACSSQNVEEMMKRNFSRRFQLLFFN